MLKTFFKVFVLLGIATYLVFALIKFSTRDDKEACKGLDVYINDEQETGFVTENEIRELLVSKKQFPEGRALDDINLAQLESLLVASPYINEALCYKTAENKISIHITPRIPVLHVLNTAGEDFYIDNFGSTMPRGRHVANLIVMTGAVNRSTAGPLYSKMGSRLTGDKYWRSQIDEIHVTSKGELELTPHAGDFIIQLGDTSCLDDKLNRLRLFYEEGLSKAGWNRYKTINLKFANQVVCTKR